MIKTISKRWCDQWVVPVVYGGLRGLRGFKIVCADSARIRAKIFLVSTALYDCENDTPYRNYQKKTLHGELMVLQAVELFLLHSKSIDTVCNVLFTVERMILMKPILHLQNLIFLSRKLFTIHQICMWENGSLWKFIWILGAHCFVFL